MEAWPEKNDGSPQFNGLFTKNKKAEFNQESNFKLYVSVVLKKDRKSDIFVS